MTKRILITAIGGDIGQSIASCIMDNNNFKIYGTETHSYHGGSLFSEKVDIIPAANSKNFLEILMEKVEKYKIDLVIPVNEHEIKVISNYANDLNYISAGKKIVNIGLDKLDTIKKLSEFGINVPWTVDADKLKPLDYPCIFKPRFSSGSRSIFIINSTTEATFFSKKYPKYVFQQLINPYEKELTCCVFRSKMGEISSIQFERELSGGMTGWARVIFDNDVNIILHKIADKLELNGSINVQLRLTENGPMIFEINPRFSSTAQMRHNLGFKDVLWSIKEFFDLPIKFSNIEPGSELVRTSNINFLKKA